LVQQFRDCVVDRSPAGVAFAIWFDRSTGLVGNTRQAARNDVLARKLDEAIYQCEVGLPPIDQRLHRGQRTRW